jgi:hypothetical protein
MAALQADELRPFLLLDLNIDDTHYRYTECDVSISSGGNLFQPRSFKISAITYSLSKVVDSMQMETDNLDDALTAAFVGGTPQGSPVLLQQVLLDSDYSVIVEPITWFDGEVDDWQLKESLRLTVVSEMVQWAQRTLNRHSPSCRWRTGFKGTHCGYSGDQTWCDRSYKRCESLGNTANFGGFRWLPSIVDAEIWWGRSRDFKG